MSGSRVPAIALVYGAALLQGLTLVSFPASSAVLRSTQGLSDAQYGLIFLPQVAASVVGGVLGGALVQRLGLARLLLIALLANAASQGLLASLVLLPLAAKLPALLAATTMLGLGFGFFGAPMNTYPPQLFPQARDTAIVAEHSVMGAGLMLGPLLLSALLAGAGWASFPLLLGGLALLLAAAVPRFAPPVAAPASFATPEAPPLTSITFWTLAFIAVIYAFAEGTFSNWAVIYLQDTRHVAPAAAGLALSIFWGAVVGGRLLVSVLVLRVPAIAVWLALPCGMALAFVLLPQADSALRGGLSFGLAGLACSAFFPLTVALASARFAQHAAWVAAMLIAALNVGTGLGSYAVGVLHAALPLERIYLLSIAYPAIALALALWLKVSGALRPAS